MNTPTPDKPAQMEQELTYNDIYNLLCEKEDIILDGIQGELLYGIRKGVSGVKNKYNAKMRAEKLPVEERTIEYTVLEEYKERRQVKLRIAFSKPAVVSVGKLIVSEE